MKLRAELTERAKQLKASPALFSINIHESKRYAIGKSVDTTVDQSHIPDDTIGTLIKAHISQSLTKDKTYIINVDNVSTNCIYSMMNAIKNFVAYNHLDSKNRLKLIKWMSNDLQRKIWDTRSLNDELGEGIYLLYKYIVSFCNESYVASDEKHVKNGYAILYAIMEKYGNPSP